MADAAIGDQSTGLGLTRRSLLVGLGAGAGLLAARGLGTRAAAEEPGQTAALLRSFTASLTPHQRAQIFLPADHPSRQITNTISVIDRPHLGTLLAPEQLEQVRELASNGFQVIATPGTAVTLEALGIAVESVPKMDQGDRDVVQRIEAGEVDLVINTVGADAASVRDSAAIRRCALLNSVPYFTTVSGAISAVGAIRALRLESIGIRAIQDIHAPVEKSE